MKNRSEAEAVEPRQRRCGRCGGGNKIRNCARAVNTNRFGTYRSVVVTSVSRSHDVVVGSGNVDDLPVSYGGEYLAIVDSVRSQSSGLRNAKPFPESFRCRRRRRDPHETRQKQSPFVLRSRVLPTRNYRTVFVTVRSAVTSLRRVLKSVRYRFAFYSVY